LLVLVLGFGLRVVGVINGSPPGLSHDEVANWLIDQQILAGRHAVYFTEAYGHEAGFHYLQAATVRLVGDNALALRMPAFFLATLLIAIHYTLIRKLFSKNIALVSAGLLATVFWGVFFSRQGLRAIMLPVVAGLSAYFWWRWVTDKRKFGMFVLPHFSLILSATFAGLSLYTYLASRAVPIFFVAFVVYLYLWHRAWVKARWRELVLFFVIMGLVSLPLVQFLQNVPDAEFRISEIDAPLRALYAGDLRPVLTNMVKNVGMFGFIGDPLWRQNVAGVTTFDWVTAGLFYAGIFLALLQWRNPRYAFLLLWMITGMIPSAVTIDAPSSIRVMNNLLFYVTFPVVTLHFIHNRIMLSTVIPKLSPVQRKLWINKITIVTVLLLIGWHSYRTTTLLQTWAENNEVEFVWQAALTDMGGYLDEQNGVKSAGIAGWTPDTMDPPTMQLSLQREDLRLAFFQPQHTLIIPAELPTVILRPTILELHPAIERVLANVGAVAENAGTFTHYRITNTTKIIPATPLIADFGDQLQLLGYDNLTQTDASLEILTYWRVIALADGERRLFLHAVGTDPLITDDGLSAPASHWQAGDLLIQHHQLMLPADQPVVFQLGVYNPQTGQRLLRTTGEDHINLP
jgi:4-amino-4-deoxy-L-arabinose transferase-like glycosyltransferase